MAQDKLDSGDDKVETALDKDVFRRDNLFCEKSGPIREKPR
jgi:hypothetical protein